MRSSLVLLSLLLSLTGASAGERVRSGVVLQTLADELTAAAERRSLPVSFVVEDCRQEVKAACIIDSRDTVTIFAAAPGLEAEVDDVLLEHSLSRGEGSGPTAEDAMRILIDVFERDQPPSRKEAIVARLLAALSVPGQQVRVDGSLVGYTAIHRPGKRETDISVGAKVQP